MEGGTLRDVSTSLCNLWVLLKNFVKLIVFYRFKIKCGQLQNNLQGHKIKDAILDFILKDQNVDVDTLSK